MIDALYSHFTLEITTLDNVLQKPKFDPQMFTNTAEMPSPRLEERIKNAQTKIRRRGL